MHELGHFIVARLVKCKVEVVSIGIGKAIFKKRIGDTVYQITPFLLGGYCKLKDELVSSKSQGSFTNLRYRDKIYLIIAGCVVNIISGLIALRLYKIGYHSELLWLFGFNSYWLGITNLIPFPALDGSYPFLVLLEKVMGKEKGYRLMEKIVKVGYWTIMSLNVIALSYLVWIFRTHIYNFINGVICFMTKFLIWFIV